MCKMEKERRENIKRSRHKRKTKMIQIYSKYSNMYSKYDKTMSPVVTVRD